MGVEMVEIGIQIRRLTIVSIRKCYRLVCNHPFLVGILFFLFFLYRSFPFLFSILVSTFPVLVCTAFLLGFLLSLGDPNIPEIEKEESVSHEIVSLRAEFQRDATVVEKDESFVVERYSGTTSRDEVENLIDEMISRNDCVDRVDGGLVNTGPLIEDYFTEINPGRRDIEGVDSDLHDPGNKNERKNDEMVFLENQYSRIEEMDEKSVGLLYTKSPLGSVDSVAAERGDSPPASPWKQFGEGDDDVAGDVADGYSDSGSDRAESSSPDASMADILPLLDELHPLLNEEKSPLVTHGSDHGSDHSSHRSRGYKEIPNDSSEESEMEEIDETKDDESKPEITWTEDDQKNLMDLGSLELERNQRLESLIARRRARKLMVEKNLIDLNYDLPFTVAPISTMRKNPFDLPYDSNENTGLLPIPGSAPSIMSRRNPFDLPYDSSEEKPDLTEDSFQQEFSPLPSRETMFRRHESFNIGPSIFAPPMFDRDDFRFRPYFVPEGFSDSSFRRQTSELSDISKVSSVFETESICSVGDQDDKKIVEEDVLEDVEIGSDLEDPSELVGHGSESSEDEDVAELGQLELREVEKSETVSLVRTLSTIEEVHYSRGSSSSSLSEEHESAVDEVKHEVLTSLEIEIDKVNEQVGEIKEPIYDLSPSSVKKNLSCSSISSDLLVEQTSEMDKKVVSFSDREIDFCTQNIEMNTVDINESSSSEVTVKTEQILDHGLLENDEKLDSTEDQDQSNQHEDDHVSSSSLSLIDHHVKTVVQNDLIEENSIGEDVVLQRNEDRVHFSSSNAYSKWISVEKPMDELHSFGKPVAELSAERHEELLLESIAEDHDEGNTLNEDHNLDQVIVQTPGSQSEATTFQVQETELIEGEEIPEMDEGLLMELDNVGDFSIGQLGSRLYEMPLVEARSVEDIDSILLRTEPVPMKNEAEMSSRMLVFEAEDVESVVYTTLAEEIEAETENKTVSEPIHYDEIDSGMHELEAASTHIIDDENPVTLDSVESLPGNVEAEVAEIGEETEDVTVLEPIHYDEIDSGMHELEATSTQDIDIAFKQIIHEEKPVIVDSVDAGSVPEKIDAEVAAVGEEIENKTVFEIDSGMHEFEAKSIQDIDAAFRQINDKAIENPVTVESLNAGSLTENFEAEVAEISEETEINTIYEPNIYDEIDSAMHELEATSIDDINTAFRETNEEEYEKPVIVESLDAELLKEKVESEICEETENKTIFEIDSGMHELEATLIQDIDSAFREINDKEFEKPMSVDSLDAESLSEKIEVEVAEIDQEPENKTASEPFFYDEIGSAIYELEATSIEDITSALKQLGGEDSGEPMIVESLEDESLPEKFGVAEIGEETENKVFEPIFRKDIDSAVHELEATSVEDTNIALKRINEEEIEKPVIADSLDAESLTDKTETEVAEIGEETETVFESNLHDEIGPAMHELDATSVEDINTALRRISEEEIEKPVIADSLDAESLTETTEAEVAEISEETEYTTLFEPNRYDEIGFAMRELEATSIEDTHTTLRQIKEEETDKPVIVESLDAESLPEEIEAEVSEIEALNPPIVETRSIEDIDLDSKQHNVLERYSSSFSDFFESHILEAEDKAEFFEADFEDASSQNNEVENSAALEPIQEEEINSGMEQQEAQPVTDLNSVFKQIKEEFENPVIAESLEDDAVPEKSEAVVSEIEIPELPVVEARSSEDIYDSTKNSSSISENDKSDTIEAEDQAEEISSTIPEFGSKSVKDIDTDASQNNEVDNPAVSEQMHDEKIDSWRKELEPRSLEDLKAPFGQIDEEEIDTFVIVGSPETDLVPEKSEVGVSELERPELPVVEARSIEDIGLAFQQVHDIDATSSPTKEVEKTVFLKPTLAETAGLESKDLEDINLTFRPTKEVLENTVVVGSRIADLAPEESETAVSEIETREKAVVETSCIEDIGVAFKQLHKSEENSSSIPELNHPVIMETEDHEQDEDINSKTFELDAQSIEDIGAASSSIKEVEKPAVFEPVCAETINLEMKDFQARSLEDVNLTLRHMEEVQKPVNITSLISDLVPDKNEAGISEIEAEYPKQEAACPIKNIDTSFDQINKVQNTSAFESVHAEDITSEMKELEAQSLEDIESALRQFKVEEIEKPMVIESLKAELIPEKDEAEISKAGSTQNEPSLEETVKELPVVEARSIEYDCNDKPSIETEDPLKPCSSLPVESENKPNSIEETGNLEKQLKSKIVEESVGTKSKDVFLSEEAETSIKEPVKAQLSGDFSEEVDSSVEISSLLETSARENELDNKVSSAPLESEGVNSSFTDGKDKNKGKSSKFKSGSSSSSSSSDSD